MIISQISLFFSLQLKETQQNAAVQLLEEEEKTKKGSKFVHEIPKHAFCWQ